MPRPNRFERHDILDNALAVFWLKGYDATSIADLEQATGLRPGSLYNSFGSKRGLFLEAIDRYVETVVDARIEAYLSGGKPLAAIKKFFRTAYDPTPDGQLYGCLLTNTATELGTTQSEVALRVRRGLERIRIAFHRRLQEAIEGGSLAADASSKNLSVHLLSCFQGLCVNARMTSDRRKLGVITNAAISTLPPPQS